jgi:hypothetical protein
VPMAVVIIGVILLVTANLLAYRNLVRNRCDRRGAFRLAAFIMLVWMVCWAIGELRLRGSPDEIARQIGSMLFGKPFGHAFAHAFMAWIAYVALDPKQAYYEGRLPAAREQRREDTASRASRGRGWGRYAGLSLGHSLASLSLV